MSKVALITGVTGQDGSYLAEFLLELAQFDRGKPLLDRVDSRLGLAEAPIGEY